MPPSASHVLYYGSAEPPPERRALRAGPLSLIFEAGDLRCIALGEREIIRRVYVAVRDRYWHTLPTRPANVQIEAADAAFRITFDATAQQDDIHFTWQSEIVGDGDGTVTFRMDGTARSRFWRNRIGICVLHPVRECAGQPCTVEQVDGRVVAGIFPRHISPHQPFTDLRALL